MIRGAPAVGINPNEQAEYVNRRSSSSLAQSTWSCDQMSSYRSCRPCTKHAPAPSPWVISNASLHHRLRCARASTDALAALIQGRYTLSSNLEHLLERPDCQTLQQRLHIHHLHVHQFLFVHDQNSKRTSHKTSSQTTPIRIALRAGS